MSFSRVVHVFGIDATFSRHIYLSERTFFVFLADHDFFCEAGSNESAGSIVLGPCIFGYSHGLKYAALYISTLSCN